MNAIEEKVLELIGESTTSPDVFTDDADGMAPIRDSINDAIQEIVILTGGNKRQYYLPLREGQAFYRIRPQNGYLGWITDAWSVTRKTRLEQTDLTRLCAYDPRWMISSAEPEAYLPVGMDVVGFYPKPSGSTNIVELTIVEVPAAYESDRDRIMLRDSFQYSVVHYAVAEYWASRGDAAESQKHMQMYLDSMGIMDRYMPQGDRRPSLEAKKEPWPAVTA